MSKIKLKDILSEAFDDTPKVDKHSVIEGVRNYGIVGKSLYNNNNVMEVAKQLAEIAESAHNHILGEQDDWFDKISVNRNMKSLKTGVMEFQKTAKEAHALNQRLTSLYEDIGHVLNRYYDIDEALTEDKGDMDNDGISEPDDEEYLDNKRDAITKAVKNEATPAPGELDNNNDEKFKSYESGIQKAVKETQEDIKKRPVRRLKDIGNVSTGIPRLGDLVKGK